MDQVKIGKFIAECRKSQNLTQLQLAEKLSITDRAVSKWETGKAMPDSAIMLQLCDVLQITVNDLLNGEKISSENYTKKLEHRLLDLIAEKETSDKQVLRVGVAIYVLGIILYLVFIAIGFLIPPEYFWIRLAALVFALLTLGFDLLYLRLDQQVGYFRCKGCGHTYTPNYFTLELQYGGLNKKNMRCPKCRKRTWHQRVYTKDKEASE